MAEAFVATPIREIAPEAHKRLSQATDGRAAKALRADRDSVMLDLEASGQQRAAMIVNFNPVWLTTASPIPYKVAPCNWEQMPEDMKITVEHEGRTYTGSYLVIEKAYIYPFPTGVRLDEGTGEDVLTHRCKYVLPVGIVLDFYQVYNRSGEQPVPMGGILVLEGDRNTFDKIVRSQGKRDEIKLRFPASKNLPNGDRSYFTEERSLTAVLTDVLKVQREFVGFTVRQARGMYADENQRKDITDQGHRAWGQYALDMGYGLETKEPWMFDSTTEEIARCTYCGSPRAQTKGHICTTCNAPFDAYQMFMGGLHVPEQYLMGLKGTELADVQAEMKRRKALFAESEAAKK